MTLNLYLSPELILDATLEELLLVEHFERNDILAALFTGEVHMAKLATPQRLSDLEVIDAPLSAVKHLRLLRRLLTHLKDWLSRSCAGRTFEFRSFVHLELLLLYGSLVLHVLLPLLRDGLDDRS